MKTIKESLFAFGKYEDCKIFELEEGLYHIGFLSDSAVFSSQIYINEKRRKLEIQTIIPLKTDKNKLAVLADLIVRINNNLFLGRFDLDFDTGVVICKTSIIVGKDNLNNDTLKHLFYSNWAAASVYFGAINAVIFQNITPKTALAMMDEDSDDDTVDDENLKTDKPFDRGLGDFFRGSLN